MFFGRFFDFVVKMDKMGYITPNYPYIDYN